MTPTEAKQIDEIEKRIKRILVKVNILGFLSFSAGVVTTLLVLKMGGWS